MTRHLVPIVLLCTGACTLEGTTRPPGDLEAFAPFTAVAAAAAWAGPGASLFALSASRVRSDGTMDLEADYMPIARYQFVVPAKAADVEGQGPVAPGAGFVAGDPIRVTVRVIRPGWRGSTRSTGEKTSGRHAGMDREVEGKATGDEPRLPLPTCSAATLWRGAIAKGAKTDVVADLFYDNRGYRLRTAGEAIDLRFSNECAVTGPGP